mmetsp:Transcript_16064/g.37897  ORF Transcript_16064/g.37897 Transcript_16064/m.37897 type:complete len:217 (+) Transcript_16064:226-876(+)
MQSMAVILWVHQMRLCECPLTVERLPLRLPLAEATAIPSGMRSSTLIWQMYGAPPSPGSASPSSMRTTAREVRLVTYRLATPLCCSQESSLPIASADGALSGSWSRTPQTTSCLQGGCRSSFAGTLLAASLCLASSRSSGTALPLATPWASPTASSLVRSFSLRRFLPPGFSFLCRTLRPQRAASSAAAPRRCRCLVPALWWVLLVSVPSTLLWLR